MHPTITLVFRGRALSINVDSSCRDEYIEFERSVRDLNLIVLLI